MKKLLNNKFLLITTTLLVGALIGWLLKPSGSASSDGHQHAREVSGIPTIYTCSMHPQIRQNEPGDCPICGMDLIPLENESAETDPLSISMSPTAMQLAGVQTLIVGHSASDKSIRLNGKIQADERQNYTQSAHIPGRIEALAVNFTGEYVSKGQVLGQLYSPELSTAQEELLQTQKIKDSQPALFKSAKEKLKNWKLSEEQIEQILNTQKVMGTVPILANVSGYVTAKMVNLGDYVQRGEAIYQITDLSKVWVLFDIYETDLQWIKKGSTIEYTVQSIPGEVFTGKLSYIDPVINPTTRVARARLEVSNPKLKLKPEMFVSGTVKSVANSSDASIVIPKSAIMWTGTRSVVYVKNANSQGVSFQLREVTLGPTLGSEYLIESGLKSGEEIAVHGTFSIDAAAQLAGKPSMMSPSDLFPRSNQDHEGMHRTSARQTTSGKVHQLSSAQKKELSPIFEQYLALKDVLTQDNLAKSIANASQMLQNLKGVNMGIFKGDVHEDWMKYHESLSNSLEQIDKQSSIEDIRTLFLSISDEMIGIAESFHPFEKPLYIQHCPMADNDRGADWLSLEENILNPYFGSSMLTCGEVSKVLD